MKKAGQVVLFRFPQADLAEGKLRPALLLERVPGPYDDWLMCMISSQVRQYIEEFDEIVAEMDEDFAASGLGFRPESHERHPGRSAGRYRRRRVAGSHRRDQRA